MHVTSMQITTCQHQQFEISNRRVGWHCVLQYSIEADGHCSFTGAANGWMRYQQHGWKIYAQPSEVYSIADISISHHSEMVLHLRQQGVRYVFKRMSFWRTRFMLLNEAEDEIVALLPTVNWGKSSYEFSIQINDEFQELLTPLLSVICLHCAIQSLKMMNGEEIVHG